MAVWSGFNPLLGILRFRTSCSRIQRRRRSQVSIPYSGFSAFGRQQPRRTDGTRRSFNPLLRILRFRTIAPAPRAMRIPEFQSPTRDSPLSDTYSTVTPPEAATVSIPYSGFSAFGRCDHGSSSSRPAVSIPYSGFSAFGLRPPNEEGGRVVEFQSPTRDSPLSDPSLSSTSACSQRSFNPLLGILRFRTRPTPNVRTQPVPVSIPYSGFSAFGQRSSLPTPPLSPSFNPLLGILRFRT